MYIGRYWGYLDVQVLVVCLSLMTFLILKLFSESQFINRFGILFWGIRKSINFDFDRFKHNLLTSNHLSTFFNSDMIEF